MQPADYIRFPRWPRGEAGPEVAREGANSIIEPELPGLGMQMQLVGRDAAIALLAATERFDRPVDTTIQMRWLHPVRVLSARPITIREIDFDLGGTVVQGKNKTFPGTAEAGNPARPVSLLASACKLSTVMTLIVLTQFDAGSREHHQRFVLDRTDGQGCADGIDVRRRGQFFDDEILERTEIARDAMEQEVRLA